MRCRRNLAATTASENFWISSIVQFGIIHTTVSTLGLMGLFAEIIKRSVPAIWAIILLILMIAASSVSFSSKNIQLAQFIILITLVLPKDQAITCATDAAFASRPSLYQ